MKREDFVFTIGYQGETAIIDGQARSRYARLSTKELAEQGLLKAAFSSALFSGKTEELDEVLKQFNEKSGTRLSSVEQLKRLLGVFEVPAGISKIKVV